MKMMLMTLASAMLAATDTPPSDDAAKFGARAGVENISLSPDGTKVAVIAPAAGQGSIGYVIDIATATAKQAFVFASGNPERLKDCNWVSMKRLVCNVYLIEEVYGSTYGMTRTIAVDEDGKNLKVLSTQQNFYSHAFALYGGSVIDWLPDEDGKVLMIRNYIPDTRLGSRLGSYKDGLAVDQIDTNSLATRQVEPADDHARAYISDGRGNVRIKGVIDRADPTSQTNGITTYYYRVKASRDWKRLGTFDGATNTGFDPVAVDPDRDIVYGFKKKDGRFALYSIALDGSAKEQEVFARPDVDVDGLERIGRRKRVVGASYATDYRQAEFFDPAIRKLTDSLHKALAGGPSVSVVDSSVDEGKLLIHASSDADPGVYYVLDRATREMKTFLVSRPQLEGLKLAAVKPVQYPAADGTMIPGYITYPPGKEGAKGLPAIVLPHGGPSSRDEWGFDWLSQFFAARGFVVLQPQFRGSSGYGDDWLRDQGFRSWRVAIGDVLDAGRWLVKQGIADPARLGVVGWSYGGYAALQSATMDPALFKAVVAIAPVTDLGLLRQDHLGSQTYRLASDFIGTGPEARAGSPAQNADKIKVPVLLFHGELDRNVNVQQSRVMASRLKSVGGQADLVTWPKLDHGLDDSQARTEMLRKTDAFLHAAMKF
jgi:dipeptidyl aminopeptidase/acylaminoacyl peptidase